MNQDIISQPVEILLVESNAPDVQLIRELLSDTKTASFHLNIAEKLSKGLKALAAKNFDLILLNLSLSDSTGLQTLSSMSEKANRVPIVVLVDPLDKDVGLEAINQGAHDYLLKNQIDQNLLTRSIRYTINLEKSEEALRKSDERYNSILQDITDGYFEIDLNGNFTFFNDAQANMLGYTRDELVGMNNREYATKETYEKVYKAFNNIYLTGNPHHGFEYEIIRKNGEKRYLEYSASLIRDVDEQPIGFRGICRDITERRRFEEALRENEERYRTIIESIEDGYFETNMQGDLTFFNEALAKIHGYPSDELIGLNNRVFMDPITAKRMHKAFVKVYQTKIPEREIQYDVIRKNGTIRQLESSVSLITDKNDQGIGHRGIVRDITERKQFEIALQEAKDSAESATQAKSEFLANMSHEIRTPMNGIIGMYNLLLGTELDTEQADYVETGKSSADSLLNIINDILDFSKIEAGKLELEILDFNLRTAMEEVVELPAIQAHAKGLEFAYQIDPEIPVLLKGDPGRLRQIILNLTSNALKFTKSGEIVIHTNLEEETATQVKIRFNIKDTGVGITKADQDRLFKSFQQVDASTTRKYGGTGLGLAISKKISELMNGEISVESEEGVGSTFWFTVVLEKQLNVKEQLKVLPESIRGKRFLLVDDNKTNLQILKRYLESWECSCDTAQSGEIALSLLNAVARVSAPFDLAIVDMLMPEMDGGELGRRIKSDPNIKDTKMIMLTSHGMRGDAAIMKEIGFAAYLTKPIRRSHLFGESIFLITNNRWQSRLSTSVFQ